jgi:CHAT domain-containing protein
MSTSPTFNAHSFSKLSLFIFFLVISLPVVAQQSQPEVRELVIGEKTERRIVNQEEVHLYGIEMKRGQVLHLSFQERGADVSAVFVRASDQQKASAVTNFGSGFMRESITLIPSQDGIHLLVVRAQRVADADPRYELTALLGQVTQRDIQRAQAEKLMEESSQLLTGSDQKVLLNAIRSLSESLKIWQTIQEPYWEAMTKLGLAGAYLKSQNIPQAERNLTEALKVFEAMRDEPEIAMVCLNFGALYMMNNDQGKAQPYLSRAALIARKLGDKRSENLMGLVAAAPAVGEAAETSKMNYLEEVSAARARNDKAGEAEIWARSVMRYAADEESMSTPDAKVLLERAEREALPLIRALKDSNLELTLVVGLGISFYNFTLDQDTDKAADRAYAEKSMRYVCEGLVLAKIQNNLIMQALAYNQLNLYYESDNDGLAIFYAKQALNAFQGMRQDLKIVDRETQQDAAHKLEEVYDSLAGDLIYEGRLSEAHQVINFGRDQEFFDFTLIQSSKPQRLAFNRRESEGDRALEVVFQAMVKKYGTQPVSDYQSGGRELRATLAKLEEIFAGRSARESALGVSDTADMQSALRELNAKTSQKYAAIYVVGDVSDNGILLITPESIMAFTGGSGNENRRATSADPEEDVPEFLKVLNSPTLDPRPLGARIYNRIFKAKDKAGTNTLEAELTRAAPDVLLWSLGGRLRYVPIAALYDSEKRMYVVEKYQNVVFTRARKERFLVEPSPWTQGVGFGTSVAYPGFSRLPDVPDELSTIFGDSSRKQKGFFNGQIFLNRAFTRQTLLTIPQLKPSLVHIASHFRFQPGDSQNSFLLLGDGNKLSLFEIQQNANLFAGVDLLTLSACETAAQQTGANGKEVDGFAEVAQRLGAHSVMASLWPISDEGTSKLMTEFYRLRREDASKPKSEVLQRAQLNLLYGKSSAEGRKRRASSAAVAMKNAKDRIPFEPSVDAPYEHPFYWAPFVLFGSPR